MINNIYIYTTDGVDPYENLATEQYLLENQPENSCTLYLWQNKNTVVIGKNQNAWAECRTGLLEEEGGHLSRRLSGGGAVFHDLGNLNFTFLTSNEDYDLNKQFSVIQAACSYAGITTECSGRNDLLAGGRKFSGNAFYHNRTHAYHHGTLMVDVDVDKLQRYLSPPKAKLEAKGIASVRSRVVNLKELSPSLTCSKMKTLMQQAFAQVYGADPQPITLNAEAACQIQQIEAHIKSWDYLFGTPLPFSAECQAHFSWGNIQIQFQAKNGVVVAAKVYTDAMDWQLPGILEQAFTGCQFTLSALGDVLQKFAPQYAQDIYTCLCDQLK